MSNHSEIDRLLLKTRNLLNRLIKWFFCACVLLIFTLPSSALARATEIERLRLAFLFQITKYIIWPEETLFPNNQLQICIVANNSSELLSLYQQQAKNKSLKGLDINANAFNSWEQLTSHPTNKPCHIIYTELTDAINADYFNQPPLNQSLIICDDIKFLDKGGMIAMSQQGSKLAIVIREEWIKQSDIKLQARFLRLTKMR